MRKTSKSQYAASCINRRNWLTQIPLQLNLSAESAFLKSFIRLSVSLRST